MLLELKKMLVNIAKKAEKEGFCKCKSGNFSIRDKETGYILITPSGVSREILNENDIIILDKCGKIIENLSLYKPSSESLMHIKIYENRPDVYGICHTHATFATAFAVQKKEIIPVVLESVYYGIKVPIAKYARTGTVELANSVVEPLKNTNACLLEKHGVVTVGKDIEEAFLNMEYVEEVAKINIYSKILDTNVEQLPMKELQEIRKNL